MAELTRSETGKFIKIKSIDNNNWSIKKRNKANVNKNEESKKIE